MQQGVLKDFFVAMWRTILLRGIASVVFGGLAIAYPGATLAVVVTIFGIYALFDGVTGLWSVYRNAQGTVSMATMLQALASVAVGLVCLIFPAFSLTYVLMLIGLWNIAAGLFQMAGAFFLRNDVNHAGWLGGSGLIGALLGLLILLKPMFVANSIIWVIAGTAILVGLVLVAFALKLRRAAANRLP